MRLAILLCAALLAACSDTTAPDPYDSTRGVWYLHSIDGAAVPAVYSEDHRCRRFVKDGALVMGDGSGQFYAFSYGEKVAPDAFCAGGQATYSLTYSVGDSIILRVRYGNGNGFDAAGSVSGDVLTLVLPPSSPWTDGVWRYGRDGRVWFVDAKPQSEREPG